MLAPLVTGRLRANRSVSRAWHVSCPLGACQGPPCRCAQVRNHVHEVCDIPQPDGVVGAAVARALPSGLNATEVAGFVFLVNMPGL
jgi:hypothetical protein